MPLARMHHIHPEIVPQGYGNGWTTAAEVGEPTRDEHSVNGGIDLDVPWIGLASVKLCRESACSHVPSSLRL